ncbi:hypothetical protein CBR_g17825 [Chara braunii]|uniref:Squalene cyclase N-terminal domain-containing protein n=1 Tax=Chara braunii TaxID=69332 RepID=A0A388KVM6_CHABU|nr:hypothetical protein CBR_g17825 [Chara braunii]|eukprot:GBG74114.1 hypothetical protein CBR_g17825 [Chara braunii]
MWRLKVGTGRTDPYLRTVKNHEGREVWEYEFRGGTEEERAHVEHLRSEFKKHRLEKKHSSDEMLRYRLSCINPLPPMPAKVSVAEGRSASAEDVDVTLRRAIRFYSTMQEEDGHWGGDYGGPMFLMPGLLIACYSTGVLNFVLTEEHKEEMRRYLYNHQNADGGWGLHIEGHSTMFGSVLSYVSLRLLGEGPEDGEDNAMSRGRNWILDHGGATFITSWGKFWLAVQ